MQHASLPAHLLQCQQHAKSDMHTCQSTYCANSTTGRHNLQQQQNSPAIMLVVLVAQVFHKDECAQLAGALLNAWTEVPSHCQDVQGDA